jgi:MerR family transcriptional regulator, thiopeptide resistance regulator
MVPKSSQSSLTISRLARRYGLARSTLLHYDRVGVLKASAQTPAGYRLYGAEAQARLARIVELRSAGLSLQTIKRVLEARTPLAEVLEKQVSVLNRQVAQLRDQQRVVLSLLQTSAAGARSRAMSKEGWTRMFRAIGLTDEDMRAWHASFEASMPEAHQDFLESLGLEATEVKRMRAWARA